MVAAAFITELKNIFNDSSITDATTENLTDAVIDELNLNGLSITNMAGSAGSKTITLTSPQEAAIRRIFRVIYASWHKNAANSDASTGATSLTATDLISDPNVQAMITQTATLLKQRTQNPPIYVANDPLPDQTY
jgi:uncharacterized protein YjgD (DUF1641 family)